MDPRTEARDRLSGRYDARVLEPSPPAVTEGPWFADDPVAVADGATVRPVVSPVTNADLTWDELCRDDRALADWCSDRWLGAWRRLPRPVDPERLAETRRAWHAHAEHVLAAARHEATGKIGLRYTRGGFGTPFFLGPDGVHTQVRVEGMSLVITRGEDTTTSALSTVAAAAKAVGVSPGAPEDVYPPATPLEPDARVDVDADSTALLGEWYGFAASVLEQVRAEASEDDDPTRLQLWPEHLDLAVDLGTPGRRGTFGASPGDAAHGLPYLYVTHAGPVAPDLYWNDPGFDGASLSLEALVSADGQRDAALAFLRRGRSALGTAPSGA